MTDENQKVREVMTNIFCQWHVCLTFVNAN